MKIRMNQAGYEGFTGTFGGVLFKAGESVDSVDDRTASRLANIVKIQREDGSNPSVSQKVLDTATRPMAVVPTIAPAPAPVKFTQEALEQVADARGIKGLREIGDTLRVKGTAIADLIQAILVAQGSKPAVEPIPAVDAPPGPAVVSAPTAATPVAPVAATPAAASPTPAAV